MRRSLPTAPLVALVLLPLVLVACDGNDTRRRPPVTTTTSTTVPSTTSSTTPADLSAVNVTLTPVADLSAGTVMAVRPDDPALYVAQQDGEISALRDGAVTPVADLSDRISAGGERGLLGMAFSSDGTHLYVHYSDTSGDTTLDEYAFSDAGLDEASRRELLKVEQPQGNHNGGSLLFGPDDLLYLALGDGGSSFDRGPGHASEGNGQSLDTLLGKVLRIDPSPTQIRQYTIPPDNPFADGEGGRPEIWLYGLRNPWRMSFDRETGDVWIGDVGQNQVEEIDMVPFDQAAGANFGWPFLEGTSRLRDGGPSATVPPVFEINHSTGACSVTGGYVYRGSRIPDLVGAYVFSDYCDGTIRAIKVAGGRTVEERDLGISSSDISSLGEDGDGELYVISQSQGVFRIDPA